MRYKVPQDVQQADKIVGPLTAMQLVEAVIGGAMAYFFYTRTGTPVNIILAILAIGITVVVVFVRVQEMSFPTYVVAVVLFLLRPRVRTWKKLSDSVLPPLASAQSREKAEHPVAAQPAGAPPSVHALAKLFDTQTAEADDGFDDDAFIPELAAGRAQTLESIRRLDERLRARQGAASENSPHA